MQTLNGTLTSRRVDMRDAVANGWDRLKDLQKRATGGANVAAEPGDDSHNIWFAGPRPAGMDTASEWFMQDIVQKQTSTALFFVGGPGAGKSHAAAEIVRNFDQVGSYNDGLAHRKYQYQFNESKILLINDATIRSNEKNVELYTDLNNIIDKNENILACVNRGVLVEEISALSELNNLGSAANLLINWLHSPDSNDKHQDSGTTSIVVVTEDYISYAKIFDGEKLLMQAVAVYVDVCSMMEPAPKTEILKNENGEYSLVAGSYEITQFNDRETLDVGILPAGYVISSIVQDILEHFGEYPTGEDPISANLLTLTSPIGQRGILSILRASELVNGQIITYRDLWGAFARCITGDLTDGLTAEQSSPDFSNFDPSKYADFESIKKLAALRFSEAIYESSYFGRSNESPRNHPILRLTRSIDPMRDSKSTTDVGHSTKIQVSQAISEAFSRHDNSTSPLQYLLSNEMKKYADLVTNFDELVDGHYARFIRENSNDSEKIRTSIAWYSRYLTRLFSTILGIPAFYDEIATWTNAWNLSPAIPRKLREGLDTLLIPNRDPEDNNSKKLMPILDSRTIPIIGNTRNPKFAMTAEHVDLATVRKAEELFLMLKEKSEDIGTIVLDFPLVREALSSSKRYPGLTELSRISAPRIERFRATRLATSSWDTRQLVIAHGNTETEFIVKERGQE